MEQIDKVRLAKENRSKFPVSGRDDSLQVKRVSKAYE